jgi:hypothetical protein
MGTELPTEVMLGKTLVLMQMTFLNNVRKVGRLVLSRTSCFFISPLNSVFKYYFTSPMFEGIYIQRFISFVALIQRKGFDIRAGKMGI